MLLQVPVAGLIFQAAAVPSTDPHADPRLFGDVRGRAAIKTMMETFPLQPYALPNLRRPARVLHGGNKEVLRGTSTCNPADYDKLAALMSSLVTIVGKQSKARANGGVFSNARGLGEGLHIGVRVPTALWPAVGRPGPTLARRRAPRWAGAHRACWGVCRAAPAPVSSLTGREAPTVRPSGW